jgi:hypothetical protein
LSQQGLWDDGEGGSCRGFCQHDSANSVQFTATFPSRPFTKFKTNTILKIDIRSGVIKGTVLPILKALAI